MAAGSSRLACAVAFGAWMWTSGALAHPLVDEARAQADRADFAAALATLDRAERADDLDRTELEELLVLRALVAVGMGRERDARRDLRRLVAIAPSIQLPDTIPPAIREMLEQVRRSVIAITLEVELESGDAGATEVVATSRGEEGVVREVRISAQEFGGDWATAMVARGTVSATLRVPAGTTGIEGRAIVVGPGGAVIAERGAGPQPFLVREASRAPERALDPDPVDDDDEDEGSGALWPIVGVTGAVVVVGVVVAALVIGSSGTANAPDGAFGAPTVAWP